MKYTELQTQLERIKSEIRNENNDTKLKQLLREKLNEIGILLYEYTSPMLTAVKKSGKNAQKDQGRGGKSVTNNFGVVTNNNCPDQGKNPDIFLNSKDSLGELNFKNFDRNTMAELNGILKTVMNE